MLAQAIDMVTATSRPALRAPLFVSLHRFELSKAWRAKHPLTPIDPLEWIPWFFSATAEGVAVSTMVGAYLKDNREVWQEWKRTGIPSRSMALSAPAYHLAIAPDGRLAQYLPLLVKGAHARGKISPWPGDLYMNSCSIAIALIGDFRSDAELLRDGVKDKPEHRMLTLPQEETLRSTLADLWQLYEGDLREVLTHSESNDRWGVASSKHCPGAFAQPAIDDARAWAETCHEVIT